MSQPVVRHYEAPPDRVFTAALQAVQSLGYKISKNDSASGALTFRTGRSWKTLGGQEMNLSISDDEGIGEATVRITVHNAGLSRTQLTDWGEAEDIAKKVLSKMDANLTK